MQWQTQNLIPQIEVERVTYASEAPWPAEADGTGGSQIRNMGPIYRAKKADADKAQLGGSIIR